MEEAPAKLWPRNLTNEELATQLEQTSPMRSDFPYLISEAERRQALAFLRSHVDQEPE